MSLYAASSRNAAIISPQNIAADPGKTIISLTGVTASLTRGYVYEFEVGADGAPNATDCAITWNIVKITSTGTGNAGTIVALEGSDVTTRAAGTASTVNNTIEPIITATTEIWRLAANQRASYRWVVNPGGPGEIVVPATNAAGLAFKAMSATYASTVVISTFFRE